MVVLAASVCTKGGKAVVSRQFMDMPRSRIEGLLASFPKLIGSTDQHTFVETDSVRYVYQPLEELYMVLITNKQSNILQDIDTLHLFGRVVSEYCRTVDEREVSKNAFSLLSVFDEIISSGGFKEDVTLSQIRTITEMESHEERVQAEIEKRKEKEAKDELNRKARAMESQKREMQKKGYVSSPNSGGFGANYGGNFNRSYTSEPSTRYEETKTSSYSQKSTPAPTGLARGMQLGKKQKDSALIDQVRTDEDLVDLLEKTTLGSSSSTPGASVQKEGIHVAVEERVTVKANRDGGLENMEIKGKLTLTVSDPAKGLIRLSLKNPQDSNTQFQTHPQIDKKLFSDDNILGLKDSSRPFPLGQALGILKWRYVSKDESSMPIAINCWPSPSGTGSCDVNIEYELQSSKLELRDVVITIPYPGSTPPTVKDVEGHYQIDRQRRTIEWKLPIIDETNKVGLLEFSVESEDVGAFYPISANFTSNSLYLDVEIDQVYFVANQDSVSFSKETLLAVDEYTVT